MEENQFLFSVEENHEEDFQEEENQEVGFINFQPETKKLEIKPTQVQGVVKIRNREQAIKYVKVAAEKVLETLNQEEQAKAVSDPDYKAVKISKLDVGTVSIIIRRALNIIIKDGNIAYFSELGYYVIDYDNAFLKTLIMVAEQSLTIKDVETVIFKIKYGVYRHVNTLTGLSHDFEEKFKDKKRFVVVGNGIFDKQEHKLLAHNPQCIRFVGVPTNYTEFETPPTIDGWNVDSWFAELMNHDEEKIKLLWQVISATLSNYSYRKSIWFLGEGLDGKSTITQLITNLIKNVGMLKANQFSERFALANLVGKLACIGEDVQANVYLDDNSNFNSVVTGDSVFQLGEYSFIILVSG